MKYIKFIVLSGLIGFTMWSCSDDDNLGPVVHHNGGVVINSPGSNDTWVLLDSTAGNINTVSWEPSDFGFAAGIIYKLEIDLAGDNFANPSALASVSGTSAGVTQGNLNNVLLSKGISGETPVQVDMRVIATVDTEIPSDTSPVVTFTVIPYPSNVVISQLGVPGDYQGWAPTDSSTAVFSPGNDNKYEGYVYFGLDNAQFKYTVGPSWDVNYGDNGGDGTLDAGGDNILAGGPAGVYRLNADINALTHKRLRTDWGLIGSATPNGWDSDQDMTFDPATNKFTITLNLVAGDIKFRPNDGWDFDFGDNDNNGSLEYQGANIPVAEAGNYTIDLLIVGVPKYKYTITKN
ncbi:MAG TPA: SusE domain-containing protein [Saprospiraceae bacterium]